MPSPWLTSITSTPAPSSACTVARTCSSVNWCDIAWLPSRSVVSVMRTGRSVPLMPATPANRVVATSSPTRAAAAVMMSRLPAYVGR